MASAKKTVVTALVRICVTASLLLPLASLAATPVAVWDGNFNAVQPGYTLNLNGNQLSADNSVITITDDYAGVDINFDYDHCGDGVTLIVRYEGFEKGSKARAIVTQSNDGGYTADRTGVDLQADNTLWGMWYNGGWSDNGTKSEAGVFPSSGCFAFTYKRDEGYGTWLYVGSDTSTISSTAAFGSSSLRASGDSLWGVTVGGMRSGTVNSNWRSAQGARITAIAVFDGVLSPAEMNEYDFPMDSYDPVTSDTTVSALNARFGSATELYLKFSPGVKLTMDTTFNAKSVKIISVGSVELVSAAQPADTELAKFDLFGVAGAVKRSWLAPAVIGFNFVGKYGTDISSALADGTWEHNQSDPAGAYTTLFADGLSTFTWHSATIYNTQDNVETFVRGYLDDGGSGATVTMSSIPYEAYDVIIYAGTDTSGRKFSPKTVNGTTYTCGSDGIAVAGNTSWGATRTATVAALGTNAMIVRDLTGPLSINGGRNANYGDSANARGGIAAIQIVPITEAFLTLSGGSATWSGGAWTDESGATIAPPTDKNVTIVVTASTTLTIDEAVSARTIKVRGSEDAVLTLVADGGSLYAKTVRVMGGVLQQGSATVLGATPAVVVEDGGTFDLNGTNVNAATTFTIAGDGAGNWPWALTSSGGDSVGTVQNMYLSGDATIGGANKLLLGKSWEGSYCYLQGHTLTKTGAGEMHVRNWNISDNGTVIVRGGELHTDQWNCLNKNTQGRVTLIIEANGSVRGTNQPANPPAATTLDWDGTLNTATRNFIVKETLNGGGSTATLNFESGVTANLTRNLTVTSLLTLSGNATFLKSESAANDVAVSPAALSAESGTITVGPGVTFNLGTSRPTATFTVDDDATISIQKATAADVPMFKVTAQPAKIVLYDESGNVVASPTVIYDSANGTISLGTGIIWVGASGTWSASQFDGKSVETEGQDISFAQGVPPQSAVTVTVDGAKSVSSMSFNASDTAYTLTGDKITTTAGLAVSGTAPVAISNVVDGTVTVNANSTLTLAGEAAVLQSGKLSGAGTLVLDPGSGKTYTMSTANTSYTGEAVIKSGTVKMGNATSFGLVNREASIRVKGGATLDENLADCISPYYANNGHAHKVVLEENAIFTSSTDNLYQGQPDDKYAPVSIITLEGDAYVVADVADAAISIAYNWDYTHIYLNNHTLTKTGGHDFYLSCVDINGAGTIDLQEGTMTICNNFYNDIVPAFSGGTLKVANGATFKLSAYNGKYPVFTIKNLELTGSIHRDNAASTLTVTGYVSGSGTTPTLTLAEGAKFKPSGNGFLRITESLGLPNGTMTIDLSDIVVDGRTSVPLFMVGSAEMLPEVSSIEFVGGSIPQGWKLTLTNNGLGYKLRKIEGFVIKL